MRRREFCKRTAASVVAAMAVPLWRISGNANGSGMVNTMSGSTTSVSLNGTLPKVRVHPELPRLVTMHNQAFIPFGTTYFRPNTGWAPQFWKTFDPQVTRRDLLRLKADNLNTVRLFIPSETFYPRPGTLEAGPLDKFDQFIELAESAGLYVQVCGLCRWAGTPAWQRNFASPRYLEARSEFWSLFASHCRGRNTILAYELANEPAVGWNTPQMQLLWNKWNSRSTPIPPCQDHPGDAALLAFQHLREHVADEWTRTQTVAIKKADPEALTTIGLTQWSVPALPPAPILYSGFRPQRLAKILDFMEIHWYPLADNNYTYQSETAKVANLAYLESVLRELAIPGLPAILGEFGWYGGGSFTDGSGRRIVSTQVQQADFCAREIQTTMPLACGWMNWSMFDDPAANDCTRSCGLFTVDGALKAWGHRFGNIAREFRRNFPPAPLGRIGPRPSLPWDKCLTSIAASETFRVDYLEAYKREHYC